MSDCAIWGTTATYGPKTGDSDTIESPRTAGKYRISGTAAQLAKSLSPPQKARLTTWLVDQRRQGVSVPSIDADTVEWIKLLRRTSVVDRIDRLLLWLGDHTQATGSRVVIKDLALAEANAHTESLSGQELWFLLETIQNSGLAQARKLDSGFDARLLIEGYRRIDQLLLTRTESSQGFVAMWFDDSMLDAFERGFIPAINDAGYEAFRIDRKSHNNKIDDEIIAEIRRSRFLVADFTHGAEGARGGVYYEAGFAHGLSIPVIFTVRADQIGKTHFDTRQYAHILWTDTDDLRRQLTNRISATLGDGPRLPQTA